MQGGHPQWSGVEWYLCMKAGHRHRPFKAPLPPTHTYRGEWRVEAYSGPSGTSTSSPTRERDNKQSDMDTRKLVPHPFPSGKGQLGSELGN